MWNDKQQWRALHRNMYTNNWLLFMSCAAMRCDDIFIHSSLLLHWMLKQKKWVNQMYTQSSNKINEQRNKKKYRTPTQTQTHTHTHTERHTQSDLQSTTIENIIYKLNKAKSSWKLKTYTCYCSCKKRERETSNNPMSVQWSKFIRHRNESNLLPKNAHSCRSFIVQLSLEM